MGSLIRLLLVMVVVVVGRGRGAVVGWGRRGLALVGAGRGVDDGGDGNKLWRRLVRGWKKA